MKEIVIIGAGGFGREVQWLIERINKVSHDEWSILGYIDDGIEFGTKVDGYEVIGGVELLIERKTPLAVACAIGSAETRKWVIDKIESNKYLSFPNLMDPSARISSRVTWGRGDIICAENIITVDITIGDFCIVNLNCTVGHDSSLESFVTLYPSVNVSGNVKIGECSEIGTGSQVIQGISIGKNSVIGAGSVVVKDVPGACTAVGCPCKPIKYRDAAFGGYSQINLGQLSFAVLQRREAA